MPESRDDSYRQRYEAVALRSDERVRTTWVAARYADELRTVGGNLVLTTARLIFEPLATKPASTMLSAATKLFGYKPVGEVIDAIGKSELLGAWETNLGEVAAVEAIPGTDRLRVTLRNSESRVFRIAASRWTPRWSSANAGTRDRVVAELTAALTSV